MHCYISVFYLRDYICITVFTKFNFIPFEFSRLKLRFFHCIPVNCKCDFSSYFEPLCSINYEGVYCICQFSLLILLNVLGACINCKSIGRNLRLRRLFKRQLASFSSNVIFQGNIETFNLVGIGPRIWKNYVTLSRYIATVNEGFLSIFFSRKSQGQYQQLSVNPQYQNMRMDIFGRSSFLGLFLVLWHVLEANVKGTQPHNLHHESRSNSPTTREEQQRQLALTAGCSPPFSSSQKTALLPTFHSSCRILVVIQNSVMRMNTSQWISKVGTFACFTSELNNFAYLA